jgi:hypothetical protein
MDISMITPTDWSECFTKYPHVHHFLLSRALENEKRYLTHELEQTYLSPERRKWVTERLAQLTQFDEK